ncbi:MAG: Fe-S protein assembly co-chaperone HscB [Polyangiaceae bacterium]
MASDPFALLGLEPRFDLDMAELGARHRELSRALHPDRHAGKTPAERRHALGKAIEVNEAFRTLKDPVSRAQAVLSSAGQSLEGQEPKPSPELLMDMMEQREALSEARQQRDAAALERLTARIEARRSEVIAGLTEAFAQSGDLRSRVVPLLGELRYYARFLEEAGAIADEIY